MPGIISGSNAGQDYRVDIMTPHRDPPGELEYGSILSNGEDWRLRKFDGGMGETEYRIFRNEKFFALLDNRPDADTVMVAMTCSAQSERDMVLDKLRNNLTHKRVYNAKTDSHWVLLDDIYEGIDIIKGEL